MYIDETAIIVTYRDTDIKNCGGYIPWYALVPFIMFDIIFQIVTMVFFIKPLCKLSKLREKQGNTSYGFQKTATKYCIITNTAIISTLILGIAYGYFGILFASAIDDVINSHCILFYEARCAVYYDFVCAPINRCIELWRKMKHGHTLQLNIRVKSVSLETKETPTTITTEKSNLELVKFPPTLQSNYIVRSVSSDCDCE